MRELRHWEPQAWSLKDHTQREFGQEEEDDGMEVSSRANENRLTSPQTDNPERNSENSK